MFTPSVGNTDVSNYIVYIFFLQNPSNYIGCFGINIILNIDIKHFENYMMGYCLKGTFYVLLLYI